MKVLKFGGTSVANAQNILLVEKIVKKVNKNPNIKCTVEQCKYNNTQEKYCTLSVIEVGTHEANPTQVQCTDCNSFELK